MTLDNCIWPKARLGEGLNALLKASGMSDIATCPMMAGTGSETGDFLEWQANVCGCVADPVELGLGQLETHLPDLCPVFVELEGERYVPVVSIDRMNARALTIDGSSASIPAKALYRALRAPSQARTTDGFSALLSAAGIQNDPLLDRLLTSELPGKGCRVGWSFRRQPEPGWKGLLRDSGTGRSASALLTAHVVQYALWLASWWILGRMSLRGQMDAAWLLAWALLLFTLIPLRVFTTYAQGVLAVAVGAALKRHLLRGAVQMDPQQMRLKGIGSILSQVFESEAVENLALSGGVSGVLAGVEVAVAAVFLGPLSLLLLIFVVAGGGAVFLFKRRYQRWTSTRMRMSEQLVESMVGHRTRIAQQRPEDWHGKEDEELEAYLEQSRKIDWTGAWLSCAVPRLWLLSALAVLAPSALSGIEGQSTIALRLGGVLLAFSALQRLTGAALDIAGTVIAGRRIAPLLNAADRREAVGSIPPETPEPNGRSKVMEIEKVEFRYQAGSKLALHPATLTIRHGDRLLLGGPSGGGKSTLSSLIAGTRQPAAGLLLAGGLDRFTLGEQGWRKRVATAPQFHENHILTETLAFNLLMGRSWPPRERDLEEAESLCRELDLGALLDRMPAGLMQIVGEGGWQLSHGERCRVFLARALLQKSSLTILDESFGALDPETAKTALQCTLAHTDALMVIAHP